MWLLERLLSNCGVQASCWGLFSHCRAWPPTVPLQELWHTGSVAPRRVGSSQTRDQTGVPCITRWILNHWTTEEALYLILMSINCSSLPGLKTMLISEEARSEVSGKGCRDWLVMSVMGTGEVFATLSLDLTRCRCNSCPVEGSNGRVGGFSCHLENSEAPRLISRPDPSSARWPRLICPGCCQNCPWEPWTYMVLTSHYSSLHRQKQRPSLHIASYVLLLSVAKHMGGKGLKKQRWVSSVLQRVIGHLCVYSSNLRIINKLHIVG